MAVSLLKEIADLNWQLIASLVLISAVVAYVGDVLGMKVGKRRVSLFGLRPRHTSSIITAVTGVTIALSTLVVLSFASSTVRSALLGMKIISRQMQELNVRLEESRRELRDSQGKLLESHEAMRAMEERLKAVEGRLSSASGELNRVRGRYEALSAKTSELEAKRSDLERQLVELTLQRKALEAEVAELKSKRDKLERELSQMRSGRIQVLAGELIYQLPYVGDRDPQEAIKVLLERGRANLAFRFGTRPEEVALVADHGDVSSAVDRLSRARGRKVLRLTASANAVTGQAVPCRIKVYDSVLVVRDREVLAAARFDGALSPVDAESALYAMLREVNQRVVRRGLLTDPLSGAVGGLSAAEFFDAVERMSNASGAFRVLVEAKGDTYTEGPLAVTVRVSDL